MAEYLVIRLGDGAEKPAHWMAVDERGARLGQPGRGELADAAREARDRVVIVLVPASEALTFSVNLPVKGARLLAALPFALEDQVADDIENLHFAPGKKLASGAVPVAVVARASLDGWLEQLANAGIQPAKLIPENHGLPQTPNTLSMLVADNQILFNDGGETAFAISGLSPSETIAVAGALGAEGEASSKHLLVYSDAAVNDLYEKDWALLRHELASVDVTLLPDGALPRLAVTVASGAGVNLLQGSYGPKTEVAAMIRPWKFAAVFLLGLGVVALLGKSADYYRLSVEHEALQQQFSEEYRQIRPNDTREIVDPVGTVNSLRRSISSGSSAPTVFLPSLMLLATSIRANDEAEVEAISYRAGVIDVRLNAPDISTLDQIVQAVNASGRFSAELKSADSVGERVNSRIQIQEAGQ
jgi:general secretion pathway protein L